MKVLRVISFWNKLILVVCLCCFLQVSVRSQCIAPYQSITYDTVITGTGNGTHSITFSQFDPNLGTLVSTQIHSLVSLNYGFTLMNVESVPRNFVVSVIRNDQIQSTALPATYNNDIDTAIGAFSLNPGESISKTPYTILYRYDNSDTIQQNIFNFLGSGTVQFNYKPLTYTNLTGSNSYYYSASANDTIHFSVTYYYCDNITLRATLTTFDAQKHDPSRVDLSWVTDNEQRGRIYEIQKSTNGVDFQTLSSLPSDDYDQIGNYRLGYTVGKSEFGKLYFRLRIVDLSGNIAYSEIKMVDMGLDGRTFYLYPNPSNQLINIFSKEMIGKHWRVDILSANGNLVQSNQYTNTSLAIIPFQRTLSGGIYFARVSDLNGQISQVMTFIVR